MHKIWSWEFAGWRQDTEANGSVANPGFTLRSSEFSRSGYMFTSWALGSADGTQYAAGANVTLAANTAMYAV